MPDSDRPGTEQTSCCARFTDKEAEGKEQEIARFCLKPLELSAEGSLNGFPHWLTGLALFPAYSASLLHSLPTYTLLSSNYSNLQIPEIHPSLRNYNNLQIPEKCLWGAGKVTKDTFFKRKAKIKN